MAAQRVQQMQRHTAMRRGLRRNHQTSRFCVSTASSMPERMRSALLGSAASACLLCSSAPGAVAGEMDVIRSGPPDKYIVDDGGILSRASQARLNKELSKLEQRTGYHVYVVTVRKLSGSDPFAFADNVIESWYPNSADGDNKGVLVLAKQSKDGALVGGPSFQERVGDDLVDSIVSDQIPYLAGQEKYNEATTSTIERISAKLQGQEVPDSPSARTRKTKGASSFKSREETENKRGLYTKVVVGLLVLSFVAPMLQYLGYVRS